jgi:hypothetical protein
MNYLKAFNFKSNIDIIYFIYLYSYSYISTRVGPRQSLREFLNENVLVLWNMS